MAAEYIMAQGNPRVILCERGIRTFETITRNTFDLAAVPVVKRLSHLPVFADPSHGTGKWYLVPPMAMAAVAAGADGLMIEVHPNPDHARSDGAQSLTFDNFSRMFSEPAFWQAAANTLTITVVQLVFFFPIPIALALLLNSVLSAKLRNVIQGIVYLPHFFSWVLVVSLFQQMIGGAGLLTSLRMLRTPAHAVEELPESRVRLSKQFLDLTGRGPMIRETIRRMVPLVRRENVWVVAGEKDAAHLSARALGIPVRNILLEPEGRNTAPAVALAVCRIARRDPEAVIVATPADHAVADPRAHGDRLEEADPVQPVVDGHARPLDDRHHARGEVGEHRQRQVLVEPHHRGVVRVEDDVVRRAWEKVHAENVVRDSIAGGMTAGEAFKKYGVL